MNMVFLISMGLELLKPLIDVDKNVDKNNIPAVYIISVNNNVFLYSDEV